MSSDDFEPKSKTDSSGDGGGRRRIRIGAGNAGQDENRPFILETEAREEAQRLGHCFIGTECLLIALARYDDDISAKALSSFGLTLDVLRLSVQRHVQKAQLQSSAGIIFDPRSKRVEDGAWEEAKRLQHTVVGPEHLLIVLLREESGIASDVLNEMGINKSELRSHLFKLMRKDND